MVYCTESTDPAMLMGLRTRTATENDGFPLDRIEKMGVKGLFKGGEAPPVSHGISCG